MDEPSTLGWADLPESLRVADTEAVSSQRRFLLIVKAQIACIVLPVLAGTIDGAITGHAWLTYVAVVGLTALAALRLLQRFSNVERMWHSQRAAAEAMRSLTWQYVAAGGPFQRETDAEAEFLTLMSEIETGSPAGNSPSGHQITEPMRTLHSATFDHRRRAYENGRLLDQRDWYSAKAQSDANNARIWDILFIAASGLAVLLGVFRVTDVLDVNLVSIFGILAAVIGTWTGVRQFTSLAATYSNAAQALTETYERLPSIDEVSWPAYVAEAEDIMTREHTMWRIRRN